MMCLCGRVDEEVEAAEQLHGLRDPRYGSLLFAELDRDREEP
jgi:hypothetical protein